MNVEKAIILAAGYGKRLLPLTLKTPKPLVKIGKNCLLEKTIIFLIRNKVKEIVINTHHLGDQIKNFLKKKKFNTSIKISDEKNKLLDTGGGVLKASKFFKNKPFIIINPDTIWSSKYNKELKLLTELYNKNRKPSLLLVHKNLSFDKSFKGDFNLINTKVRKDKKNNYIFTGLQIIDHEAFHNIRKQIFSMNKIWHKLMEEKKLLGIKSKKTFYHVNNLETYEKLLKKI